VEEKRKISPGLVMLGIIIVVILVIAGIILIFPPKGDDNGGGNGDKPEVGPWKDLTKMKASVSEVRVFNYNEVNSPQDLDSVQDPEDTVYLLIGIESNLTSADLVSISDFCEKGGKVIIADDGTKANRLTDYTISLIGGKATFMGHDYLVDRTATDTVESGTGWVHNIRFIKGYSFPIKGQQYNVLADKPRGLNLTGDPHYVVTTTKELTIVDMNDNGIMDQHNGEFEPHYPYGAFGARYDAGTNGGSITFFSTTGMFTDSMYAESQNEGFLRAYLYSLLPEGGDLLLDDSKQMMSYSPHRKIIPAE
jgi:hypothetical protein